MEGVYASTTIDDVAKLIIVKVVNIGEGYADGVVNLSNCSIDKGRKDALKLIRLSAENGAQENTIDNPGHINPTNGTVKFGTYNNILFDVPAFSVNIIRIPIK